ncbi:MAG TPA: hypothetical protein VKO63_12765 [Chitinispirillaceae bacterium]|nr:hypothetical protein [Chitinispirillaceae bacterium]
MIKNLILVVIVFLVASCNKPDSVTQYNTFCKDARLLIVNGGYPEQIDKTIVSGMQLLVQMGGKPEAATISSLIDSLSVKIDEQLTSMSESAIIRIDSVRLLAAMDTTLPWSDCVPLYLGDTITIRESKTDSSGNTFYRIDCNLSKKGWIQANAVYRFDNYSFQTYQYSTWPESEIPADTPLIYTGAFYDKVRKNRNNSFIKYILPATLKADVGICINEQTKGTEQVAEGPQTIYVCGTPLRILDTTDDKKYVRVLHWEGPATWVNINDLCIISYSEWETFCNLSDGYRDIKGRYSDENILFNEEFLNRAKNGFGNCFYTIYESLFGEG